MHFKRLKSARSVGFHSQPISQRAETPTTWKYLRHKSSFLIASFALVAFVAGNMLGMNGWHVFWKSVWGEFDDSLIAYTGTVTPAELVADMTCWSKYGGNSNEHTWRQVPEECRIPMPRYAVDSDGYPINPIFSQGYMGQEHANEHPGIDVRMPVGTPIRAVMRGIVTEVDDNPGGFGKYVVVRHPNVPDPGDPKRTVTLFSVYAHLNAQLVEVGQVVDKGEEIAYSGRTGKVTGAHLHFQVDREKSTGGEETPWHPYWDTVERDGYAFTVHPLFYVQADFPGIVIARKPGDAIKKVTTIAMADPDEQPRTATPPSVSKATLAKSRALQSRQTRIQQRLALQRFAPKPVRVTKAPSSEPAANAVAGVEVNHDGVFVPGEWKTVRVTLLDADGRVTQSSGLNAPLYMRTAFGYAQFDPPVLTSTNFKNGEAEVRVLPQGTQTVVIDIKPMNYLSKPLKFAGR